MAAWHGGGGGGAACTHTHTHTHTGDEPSTDPTAGVKALNGDWMKFHAQNVTNTLPGGVCVVGVYVFCPRDVDTQGVLRNLVYKVSGTFAAVPPPSHHHHPTARQRPPAR